MSILPATAAAAASVAVASYLNARFHIAHDIRSLLRSGGAAAAMDFLTEQFQTGRPLTYHILEDQALRNRPHQVFLIFEDRRWTYAEFFNDVTRMGNWLLKELDIQKGEIVAIDGGNSPEYLMLWIALEGVGAIPSFINNNLTGKGLLHCVQLCNARYIICDRDNHANVGPCEEDLKKAGTSTVYYDLKLVKSMVDSSPLPTERQKGRQPEDMNSLIYTSGTTGLPKAIIISTGRELLIGFGIGRYLGLKPSDRMYTCMPLYHGAAHGLCVTPSIRAGSSIVLGRKFSHKRLWPEVRSSNANILQYVGELCRYLLNAPPSPLDKQHNVKMAWGNGMRPDVWEKFRERFGIPVIHELYAATDGMGAMYNLNRGEFTRAAIGQRGLIWHLVNGRNEVRVKIDVDTEEILKDENGFAIKCRAGEAGEVIHQLDPSTPDAGFSGYYGNQAAGEKRKIRDVFKKGDLWFRSGDMMRVDSDGRVYFVDRLGDTFRWKSENVSTNEVSDIVGEHPAIAEANVYGVSVPNADGRYGCAAIVLAEGVNERTLDFKNLAEYLLNTLPRYAVPIFLRLTPELDYTGTLKLQKGRLKREGINVDVVSSSGDKLFWMPGDERTYVPFDENSFSALKAGKVRL